MNDQSCAEGNHHVIVGQKYLVKSATRRFATRIRDRRRTTDDLTRTVAIGRLLISFKLAQSHFCLYSKKYEFFNYKFSNIIKKILSKEINES